MLARELRDEEYNDILLALSNYELFGLIEVNKISKCMMKMRISSFLIHYSQFLFSDVKRVRYFKKRFEIKKNDLIET